MARRKITPSASVPSELIIDSVEPSDNIAEGVVEESANEVEGILPADSEEQLPQVEGEIITEIAEIAGELPQPTEDVADITEELPQPTGEAVAEEPSPPVEDMAKSVVKAPVKKTRTKPKQLPRKTEERRSRNKLKFIR